MKLIYLPDDPTVSLFGSYRNELKTNVYADLHRCVYSSCIYDCQNLEATKMPVNIQMAKHTVDSPNNGIMFRDFKKSSQVKKRHKKNLLCRLLSERRQSNKAAYCKIATIWHLGKGKTMEMLKRHVRRAKMERLGGMNGGGQGIFKTMKLYSVIL